ncbi:hypothetical protein EVG20_g6929, partial [Dentipellis fragilis]
MQYYITPLHNRILFSTLPSPSLLSSLQASTTAIGCHQKLRKASPCDLELVYVAGIWDDVLFDHITTTSPNIPVESALEYPAYNLSILHSPT